MTTKNFKFICHEDMKQDTSKVVTELSELLGYEFSPEKVEVLVKYVSLNNMSKLGKQSAPPDRKKMVGDFFRKGTVGDWANYFDGERLKEWNEWTEKSIEGTDIKLRSDKL